MKYSGRSVLITGCSSGIGKATAEHLCDRGWRVIATARKPETIEDLAERGCITLPLDVTDEDSMRSAVETVEDEHGGVWGLVNNAGYGLFGAVETTPIEAARAQFETNFFGLARLTQLVLPGMRARRAGRIVNMSSMGGRLTLVCETFYHASKHALEAFSDGLRYEVRPFGIHVVVIEPGVIRSRFGETGRSTIHDPETAGAYAKFNERTARLVENAYEGRLSRFLSPPSTVAKAVERSLTARKPRTRYPVTVGARAALVARTFLPDRAFDAVLRRVYGEPKPT